MLTAREKTIRQALEITRGEKPNVQLIRLAGGRTTIASVQREISDRITAIKYVLETGLEYRPLVDKWRRGK